ncbi:MAG TPA: hypothetical protein VF627_15375 [Abditibacterium sp.]|jgi:hypothetical protein
MEMKNCKNQSQPRGFALGFPAEAPGFRRIMIAGRAKRISGIGLACEIPHDDLERPGFNIVVPTEKNWNNKCRNLVAVNYCAWDWDRP